MSIWGQLRREEPSERPKGRRREGQFDDDTRWPEISRTIRVEEACDAMGIHVLYERGGDCFAHCPLPSHPGADNNPSFSYSPEKQGWICFTCDEHGGIPSLAMNLLELGYSDALDWLIEFSEYSSDNDATFISQIEGLLNQEKDPWRERNTRSLPWYPASKVDEWHTNLADTDDFWTDTGLVIDGRERYVSREVAEFLKLGFDPEHTKGKGGGYRGPALIIPVFVGDQCIGWQERWLDDDRPNWVGKYTNTTDFPREQTLYNQDMLKLPGPVIVNESPMTVARLLTFGLPAVATYGAKVTDEQIRLLAAHKHLWLAMDNDEAGERATKRLIEALDDDCILHVIPPPTFKAKADLADCNDPRLERQLKLVVPSILHRANP